MMFMPACYTFCVVNFSPLNLTIVQKKVLTTDRNFLLWGEICYEYANGLNDDY